MLVVDGKAMMMMMDWGSQLSTLVVTLQEQVFCEQITVGQLTESK